MASEARVHWCCSFRSSWWQECTQRWWNDNNDQYGCSYHKIKITFQINTDMISNLGTKIWHHARVPCTDLWASLFCISSHCFWGQVYCENMFHCMINVGSYFYNAIVSNYVIRRMYVHRAHVFHTKTESQKKMRLLIFMSLFLMIAQSDLGILPTSYIMHSM